jgi:hypothetical protein
MAAPAVRAGTAVTGVGGQCLPEHSAAELEQPGPQDRLGRLQSVLAAQRPGCHTSIRDRRTGGSLASPDRGDTLTKPLTARMMFRRNGYA